MLPDEIEWKKGVLRMRFMVLGSLPYVSYPETKVHILPVRWYGLCTFPALCTDLLERLAGRVFMAASYLWLILFTMR